MTPTKAHWKIADGKSEMPACSMQRDSFGVQVLIWPPFKQDGAADAHVAFYGCRVTDKPSFYIYGRTIDVGYWAPLPDGPQ